MLKCYRYALNPFRLVWLSVGLSLFSLASTTFATATTAERTIGLVSSCIVSTGCDLLDFITAAMKDSNQSNRMLKRPRASNPKHPSDGSDDRVKRSRLSPNGDDKRAGELAAPAPAGESVGRSQSRKSDPADWSLSLPLAGQYTNLDPVFTSDEE